ncbi:hypothetical protein SAMN05661091_5392 [Paenibacillus uliginis N3/975]|uniref:Uncharacterized protein n=1 Tax=Paenibacillus uliginis N3/975 TaxID=1313296 RepID=A0A1X7HSR8_9BACL|nr:hypothetical protein [Paenibacillus uliginis]SMF91256.1 hypothetical protein SAMN05661091_5392 [Paenibacillus uliginis N3/975]
MSKNNLRDDLLKSAWYVGGPIFNKDEKERGEEVIIEVYNPLKEKVADNYTRTSVQYRNVLHAEFKEFTKNKPGLSKEIINDLLEFYLYIRRKILSEVKGEDRAH